MIAGIALIVGKQDKQMPVGVTIQVHTYSMRRPGDMAYYSFFLLLFLAA